MAAITAYIIAEKSPGGEYWSGARWTPASNEAYEYDNRLEAQEFIEATTDDRDALILTREYDTWGEAENQRPSRVYWSCTEESNG